ncbi:S8 family serine peptidase [Gottfriedia sp. NPDC057991]|uniref:S8 family serine peptidase n=1 Tax=Gottfriedia sp. NPDC057991 TaxID=3346298 RepID=UPI0036DAEA9E
MKRRNIKALTVTVFSTGLLLSSVGVPYFVANAQTPQTAENVLASLTDAQRQALHKLKTDEQSGLILDKSVDLNSEDNVSVIVEFKQKPAKTEVALEALEGKTVSQKEATEEVEQSHDEFQKDINDKNIKAKVVRTYKKALNGVAITLPANQVKSLLSSNVVQAVYSNETVSLPPEEVENQNTNEAKPLNPESIPFLGIDKLHAEGFTGKGVKVGVIDTGIDYNHPDLKDAYKGGYDFVDNDSDPMETTYADWKKSGKPESNGSTYYTSHGTHVSGTIVGQAKNNSEYSVTGVAPDADLYMYRALGPYGSGSDENVIAAVDKAVQDGMDIISLSLGENYNSPIAVTSIALDNAALAGVVPVVAAGNSGNQMYTLGSPGAAALAITVGASTTPIPVSTIEGKATVQGEQIPISGQLIARGFNDHDEDLLNQNTQFAYAFYGKDSDYYYSKLDATGKVVLIGLSNNISPIDQIKMAKQKGAKAVLLYNNDPQGGVIPAYIGESQDYIPTYSLSYAQGASLAQKLIIPNTNYNYSGSTFTFNTIGKTELQGDTLASFSSRGPARITFDIKPEVTAPGVSVLSTVPSYMTNPQNQSDYTYAYSRYSGTSMATPHVAGIAALILQAHPDYTPADVKEALMNTAVSLKNQYSVYEVGAGRVNPYDAVHADVSFEVKDKTTMIQRGKERLIRENTGSLSFGLQAMEDKDFQGLKNVTIRNNSSKAKTFDVNVTYNSNVRGSKDAEANGVKILTNSSIKVGANKKIATSVFLSIPKNAEKGIYEGYVTYTNHENSKEVYHIPFGVRTVEDGIASFKTDYLGVRTDTSDLPTNSTLKRTALSMLYNLKSPMKTVDFVLADESGKELGYLGGLDGLTLSDNVDQSLSLFDGYYFPFTGDVNRPISDDLQDVKQGLYKIKMIATSDLDKTYTAETNVFVDNTPPKLTLNTQPGIYEYEKGETSFKVRGNIYDEDIATLQAKGLDVKQSDNSLYSNYGNLMEKIPLSENGDFEYDFPIKSVGIQSFSFYPTSFSTMGQYKKANASPFILIQKGTPYISMSNTKEITKEVTPGDKVTFPVIWKNVSNVKGGEFTINFEKNNVEMVDVQPTEALKALGNVNITSTLVTNNTTNMAYKIHVEVDGNIAQGLNGDVPLVNITANIKDNHFTAKSSFVNFSYPNFVYPSYIQADGKKVALANSVGKAFIIKQPYSEVNLHSYIEGLLKNGKIDTARDYSKLGIQLKAIDSKNIEYPGTILPNGQFSVSKLPLSSERFTLSLKVPGHFEVRKPFYVGTIDGETIDGQLKDLFAVSKAGDVNGDNVIDIMDALYIQTYWNTNKREADINADGTVDAKDMAFVKNNYLMKNPSIQDSPDPKKKYKNKTLEDVLADLGL